MISRKLVGPFKGLISSRFSSTFAYADLMTRNSAGGRKEVYEGTVEADEALLEDPDMIKTMVWRKVPLPSSDRELIQSSEVLINGKKHETLVVDAKAIEHLTTVGMIDINHLLRSSHLKQLSTIFDDSEASDNDRFVATELLKNANIAAGMTLPSCQDCGTSIAIVKKTPLSFVVDENNDLADTKMAISRGVYEAYATKNLRYSQVAALDMYTEKNTGSNLPAQVDIYSVPSAAAGKEQIKMLFLAKGGGSANKTFLFQQNKSLLNKDTLYAFLREKIADIGTSACPPYHLAIVIGGLSAEQCLQTVKYASARELDDLHVSVGSKLGANADSDLSQDDLKTLLAKGVAFRDVDMEADITKMCHEIGIGAQFGGKYFVHDVRVIRLPRHGASLPVGLGVSCSADRQINAKITKEGLFLEQLETNPARYMPAVKLEESSMEVKIDLNKQSLDETRKILSQYPIATRLSLSGTIVVARDMAHMKLKQDYVDQNKPLPDYVKNRIIYYAGPAKTPKGMASGSFGPTTAGRMDAYIDLFQSQGASLITLAKGNRSRQVTTACKKHKGFYLGSIGGPAAILAKDHITRVTAIDYKDLGMEAVWEIDIKDFPAFIIVDDKGNDFFSEWSH